MTCECDVCKRAIEFRRRLELIPDAEREYWSGIFMDLEGAELDRDVNRAVIDGSWPDADKIIEGARAKITEASEEDVDHDRPLSLSRG